jgi:hypothetical protein
MHRTKLVAGYDYTTAQAANKNRRRQNDGKKSMCRVSSHPRKQQAAVLL